MRHRLAQPATMTDIADRWPAQAACCFTGQKAVDGTGCCQRMASGGQCQFAKRGRQAATRRTLRSAGPEDQHRAQDLVGGRRRRPLRSKFTVGLGAASASTEVEVTKLSTGQGLPARKAGSRRLPADRREGTDWALDRLQGAWNETAG